MRFRALTVSAVLTATSLMVTGCSDDYTLHTHCGIYELSHDGKWYVRDGGRLDNGYGNPPNGWNDPYQRGDLSVHGDTAVFTDAAGHREVFTVRKGATRPLQVCS